MADTPERLIDPIEVSVGEMVRARGEALDLQWIAGESAHTKLLEPVDAEFPGMALVGYLNPIHPHRVQVLSRQELDYLTAG